VWRARHCGAAAATRCSPWHSPHARAPPLPLGAWAGLLRGRFFCDLASSEGAPGSGVRDGFACGSSGIFASRGKEFPDFHTRWHIV